MASPLALPKRAYARTREDATSVFTARSALTRVADHRQVADRQPPQLLRPVRRVGVEVERVTRGEQVGAATGPVHDLALEHVEELDPRMLQGREHVRLGGEGDQVGLYHQGPRRHMSEQLILVPGPRAAPLVRQA